MDKPREIKGFHTERSAEGPGDRCVDGLRPGLPDHGGIRLGRGHARHLFERPSEEGRTATPGWYNTIGFTRAARAAGLYAKNINGDAFSNEIKAQALEAIRRDLGQVDLVVYSLASPRRVHPGTGAVHKSVLKPVGAAVHQQDRRHRQGDRQLGDHRARE
jgi:hypothetical protein